MAEPTYLKPATDGVYIHVRVQPRSRKNRIEGVHDGRLKIRLTAPPVEGAANKALIAFLADVLDVPRRQISLVRGEKAREKVLLVEGLPLPDVAKRLDAAFQRR
ncbi:MAG: YggU family protein [Chloroflexi bacterium]|nr:YggU family protein [Chloroflexota bacterium]